MDVVLHGPHYRRGARVDAKGLLDHPFQVLQLDQVVHGDWPVFSVEHRLYFLCNLILNVVMVAQEEEGPAD